MGGTPESAKGVMIVECEFKRSGWPRRPSSPGHGGQQSFDTACLRDFLIGRRLLEFAPRPQAGRAPRAKANFLKVIHA